MVRTVHSECEDTDSISVGIFFFLILRLCGKVLEWSCERTEGICTQPGLQIRYELTHWEIWTAHA